MVYYDIHTHQMPVHPGDMAIVNTIVGPVADSISDSLVDTADVRTDFKRSYGIHPWYIYNVREQMEELRRRASAPETVAIGEAGLDKLAESPMDIQKEVFLAQAFLAEEIHKPFIIHCVKAWQELIACRKAVRPDMPWVIHGFRGNGELAAQLIHLGFFLSFGDRFNPSAIRVAWPDSLFLETDDKPVDIRLVYQDVAKTLQLPERDVLAQIAHNFSLFK